MKKEIDARLKFEYDVSQLKSFLVNVLKHFDALDDVKCSELITIKRELDERIKVVINDAESI